MGQIIFTEFELQVLETARIVGGKGETPIQCHCTNTTDGCGINATQINCTHNSHCMYYITQNCSAEDRCITPVQELCI